MKKEFLILILFIKISLIFSGKLLDNGMINVSYHQFNDEELEWVKDEYKFGNFSNYFDRVVQTTFESQYCSNLQQKYQGTVLAQIKTIFGTILSQFLYHRCTNETCLLSQYWNETNQNLMPLDTYYDYTSEAIYLLIPLFLTIVMMFFIFGFFNCLYFNYCYCCCYSRNPTKKEDSFFNKMYIVLAISSTIYIGGGVFIEYQFTSLKTYENYITCQIISNNVYQVITGIDLTNGENKATPEKDLYWQGLSYLNITFRNYFHDLEKVRTTLKSSINQKYLTSEIDPVNEYYKALQNGIEQFKNYTESTNYEIEDLNGANDPLFNITYTCSICKNKTRIDEAYFEVNETLYLWQMDMQDYRDKIYSDLIEDKGWNFTRGLHEDTTNKIKENIYKSYKFYNIVMDNLGIYQTTFNTVESFDIIFFIINTLLCILGILGYRWVKASIDLLNSGNEKMNYKGAAERDTAVVKSRWTFHLVINFNMFTSIFVAACSFALILLAVFVYEGGVVMENYFFNKGRLGNFTFVPHGAMIDVCVGEGKLDNFFNFTDYYNNYKNMINYTEIIKSTYAGAANQLFPKYNELVDFVRNMDLSNFHKVDDKTLVWDPDGEQINYFLFPLNSYKYIKTPPEEVLREYTDYSFIATGIYENKQKKWCTSFTTLDIWADSSNTCKKKFPTADLKITITPLKELFTICYPLSMQLITESCPDYYLPNCYIDYFSTRYNNDFDFSNCQVPQDILDANFVTNSKSFFLSKIQSILTSAKYEHIVKTLMDEKLNTYKNNLKIMIEDNYNAYKMALLNAYKYYITLSQYYEQLSKWFIRDESIVIVQGNSLNRFGLMRNTECTFLKNNFKLFYFARTLLGEEYFGISIVLMFLSIFLYINATFTLVVFLRLRTEKELSELRNQLETIKTIEEKEKRYFFANNVFIETDDAKMMGLDEDNDDKEQSGIVNVFQSVFNRKSFTSKVRPSIMVRAAGSDVNKNPEKKFDIIKKFLAKQEREYDERNQDEKNKSDN